MNDRLREVLLALQDATRGGRRKPGKKPPKRPDKKPPRPEPGPQPQPVKGDGACVARCAEEQVGKRYVWATAGPNTFDCSGLVAFCVKRCTGQEISRGSWDQSRMGSPVVAGKYLPGDILHYGGGSHVGIVTGPNRAVHALNPGRGVVVATIPGNMGLSFDGARRIVAGGDAPKQESIPMPDPRPTPLPEPGGYIAHDLPGTDAPFYLPSWLRYRVSLTPPGPNRQQHHMNPTVTVAHSTGNPRDGANAADHAQWQANGTPGHPDLVKGIYVGVHAYVDAKEVVWTIPINEKGVHSGDWRDDWGIAIERTVNADQDQAEAENNAMHVHAGLLYLLGKSARDAMYPHTDGGHCPELVQSWREWERIVDMRIGRIAAAVEGGGAG